MSDEEEFNSQYQNGLRDGRAEKRWRPIETAPKDGTAVDLWVKRWVPETDGFQSRRIANASWAERGYWNNNRMFSSAGWTTKADGVFVVVCDSLDQHFPAGWRPTHWMPLPPPPPTR